MSRTVLTALTGKKTSVGTPCRIMQGDVQSESPVKNGECSPKTWAVRRHCWLAVFNRSCQGQTMNVAVCPLGR